MVKRHLGLRREPWLDWANCPAGAGNIQVPRRDHPHSLGVDWAYRLLLMTTSTLVSGLSYDLAIRGSVATKG